jgi:hypothetical protein
MTLAVYTNGHRSSTRRRYVGTAHSGQNWTSAVQVLRTATRNAVIHAGWRRSITADRVGSDIIDGIGTLDRSSLHVLAVVFGILSRAAQHDHQ